MTNWQPSRDGVFLAIREDEYDEDPPPAYHRIGPRPVAFRDCVPGSSAAGHGGSGSSRYIVRDMQRRRSFGIGGAGNIRTTKESGIVVFSASALLTSAPPESSSAALLQPPTATPSQQPPPSGSERRGSASGANDLRDKLVGSVKTIFSGVGQVMSSGSHDSPESARQ